MGGNLHNNAPSRGGNFEVNFSKGVHENDSGGKLFHKANNDISEFAKG